MDIFSKSELYKTSQVSPHTFSSVLCENNIAEHLSFENRKIFWECMWHSTGITGDIKSLLY